MHNTKEKEGGGSGMDPIESRRGVWHQPHTAGRVLGSAVTHESHTVVSAQTVRVDRGRSLPEHLPQGGGAERRHAESKHGGPLNYQSQRTEASPILLESRS
jgi:hypothetical protein